MNLASAVLVKLAFHVSDLLCLQHVVGLSRKGLL